MGGDDVFMTEKTFFHFRESGMFRPLHVGMAEPAIDGLDPGMDPVAERNGLSGSDPLAGVNIKKIEHQDHQQNPCGKPFFP
jgi:hypothetical protein